MLLPCTHNFILYIHESLLLNPDLLFVASKCQYNRVPLYTHMPLCVQPNTIMMEVTGKGRAYTRRSYCNVFIGHVTYVQVSYV